MIEEHHYVKVTQRRRQARVSHLFAAFAVTLVAASTAGAYVANSGAVTAAHSRATGPGHVATNPIRLERPGALAVERDGSILVADDGRNQILQLRTNGKWRVIAGTGSRGFAGDGGPAVDAKLNNPGGIAIGGDGVIYIADTGNNRVRSISPDGIIQTIAGTGRSGWVKSGTLALHANLGGPSAVAEDSRGRLFIADAAANQVLELRSPGAKLTMVAGNHHFAGVYGVGHAAIHGSPDGPNGLTFDRRGNLYIAGLNTKTLLLVTPAGVLRAPAGVGNFYPRGAGSLVTSATGTVIAANGPSLVQLSPRGVRTLVDFSRRHLDDLGVFVPQGVAMNRTGDLYADTWSNGFAKRIALIRISSHGRIRVLWKS